MRVVPCISWPPARTEILRISGASLQDPEEGAQLTAALRFSSAPDLGALEAALRAVADRHDLLRTKFSSTSKGTLQVGFSFFTSRAP